MKTTEVNEEMIGKRCKCIFAGLMVTGTIEGISKNKYTADVKVRFDRPHQWGKDIYEYDWSHARLHDEFGSLQYLEIIDDNYETLHISFDEDIEEIDDRFARNYSTWGAVNLKEWVDNYESSHFSQTGDRTAVITSGYNMEHIKEWLLKNTAVAICKQTISKYRSDNKI